MTGHTLPSAPRTSRSVLRVALAAAFLGALCACAASDPTGSTVSARQRPQNDDNSGIMGSGYRAEPDTTHHP